jgi:hypothetical protein
MKIKALLFVLFIYSICNAQNTTIEVGKMNVFYIGVENPVTVLPKPDSISISNGKLLSSSMGSYLIETTETPASKCIIKAWKNGKVNASKEFRVKRIPIPEITVLGKSNTIVPASLFHKSAGVNCILENFDFDVAINIKEYEVTYIPKKGIQQTTICIGAVFSSNVKYWVENAKSGDIFLFKKVQGQQVKFADKPYDSRIIEMGGMFIEVGE